MTSERKREKEREIEWSESFNTCTFYEIVGANPMKSKIYDAIYVIIHTFEDGEKKAAKSD